MLLVTRPNSIAQAEDLQYFSPLPATLRQLAEHFKNAYAKILEIDDVKTGHAFDRHFIETAFQAAWNNASGTMVDAQASEKRASALRIS